MQRLWSADELGERWTLRSDDLAMLAGLPGTQPQTPRHSSDFAIADKGHDLRLIQDYRGHHDPRYAVLYTRTTGWRFEGLWER